MDLDDAAPQTARRTSSAHGRPSRAPSGPRIRTRTMKHSAEHPSPGPPSADGPASPLSVFRPDSPGADPAVLSIDVSLPHPPLPALPHPLFSLPAHADAAVQVLSTTPPPAPSPSPAPTSKPASTLPKSTAAAGTTFTPPPPLTPPPAITFESKPIPWRGLPLEAAQWTFSSTELQEIVSSAIRLSAREPFVRLLSLQALEVDIVHETERLHAERVAAQAKWRFEVGRRTMLMQALNSSAATSGPGESANPITAFIGQLASSVASCDALLSSILHFSDQQSQIALIQHQHWASALAVALRKLKRAYECQEQELKCAQARAQTLEDELEEAWREAEKMAIEFDDLEEEVAANSTEDGLQGMDVPQEDNGDAESQWLDAGPRLKVKQDPDETGTLGDVNTDVAVVLGVTATAVASKATLVSAPVSPRVTGQSDTKSIRSVKSTRSRRSMRDGPGYVSRLSAARTRSRTASNASLRLPKALRSVPSTPVNAPPIPALPQDHSFLDMDTFAHERVHKTLPPQRLCCVPSFLYTCSHVPTHHRTAYPEPSLALPIPPHSAGLPPTRVPSIWLETDGGDSTRLNGLDRTHSLQIFSSLMTRTPRKTRRSNLVMSLVGSDQSLMGSPVETSFGSPSSLGMGIGTGAGTASPTSNSSPVSLPAHALAHFRSPSLSSSATPRPGSAGARLTTTMDTRTPMPVATPRRSLVSRASSVILRRLSQATMGGSRGGKVAGLASPSRSREALRLSGGGRALERWKEEGEGQVMVIGSPDAALLDG
ncbi:hypothetical protein J3R82DRAFT_2622 [Butyriboletus roseoflavus]|nr:hypothetical protein J3R82DRAFT_2622 [Butyriboletus roseoflavus]